MAKGALQALHFGSDTFFGCNCYVSDNFLLPVPVLDVYKYVYIILTIIVANEKSFTCKRCDLSKTACDPFERRTKKVHEKRSTFFTRMERKSKTTRTLTWKKLWTFSDRSGAYFSRALLACACFFEVARLLLWSGDEWVNIIDESSLGFPLWLRFVHCGALCF